MWCEGYLCAGDGGEGEPSGENEADGLCLFMVVVVSVAQVW
jgi:hypothetical protein